MEGTTLRVGQILSPKVAARRWLTSSRSSALMAYKCWKSRITISWGFELEHLKKYQQIIFLGGKKVSFIPKKFVNFSDKLRISYICFEILTFKLSKDQILKTRIFFQVIFGTL